MMFPAVVEFLFCPSFVCLFLVSRSSFPRGLALSPVRLAAAWTDWVGFASPAIQSRRRTKAKHAPKWKIADLKYLKHEPDGDRSRRGQPKVDDRRQRMELNFGWWGMNGWITFNGDALLLAQRGCGWMGDYSGINSSGRRRTIQRLHW
jgi:hypothetical protein